MHAEESQARLERESNCKSEESDKEHRSVPTCCLDPLEAKLGFSPMSNFTQSADWLQERCPMASRKEQLFSLFFGA